MHAEASCRCGSGVAQSDLAGLGPRLGEAAEPFLLDHLKRGCHDDLSLSYHRHPLGWYSYQEPGASLVDTSHGDGVHASYQPEQEAWTTELERHHRRLVCGGAALVRRRRRSVSFAVARRHPPGDPD